MSMAASQSRFEHFGAPIVVMGVSGCGKSSIAAAIAAKFGWRFIEGDNLHPTSNIETMSKGIPLTDDDRLPWLAAIGTEIGDHQQGGIVVSCSALKRSYRDLLREAAQGNLVFVYLYGSRQVLEQRMSGRQGHFMPVSLLENQLEALQDPRGETGVITVVIDQPVADLIDDVLRCLKSYCW
jgi:gluconokinase